MATLFLLVDVLFIWYNIYSSWAIILWVFDKCIGLCCLHDSQSKKQKSLTVPKNSLLLPFCTMLFGVTHYLLCISSPAHSLNAALGQENSSSARCQCATPSTAHDTVRHSLRVTHSSLGILDAHILLVFLLPLQPLLLSLPWLLLCLSFKYLCSFSSPVTHPPWTSSSEPWV